MRKFPKKSPKIEVVGTCPNFKESLERTLDPLGLNR